MRTKRVFASVLAFVVVALASSCLQGGHEGDRCNPDLSHDECGRGLTCETPPGCAESYCCPTDLATSKSAFCRGDPSACPAPPADASVDGEGG